MSKILLGGVLAGGLLAVAVATSGCSGSAPSNSDGGVPDLAGIDMAVACPFRQVTIGGACSMPGYECVFATDSRCVCVSPENRWACSGDAFQKCPGSTTAHGAPCSVEPGQTGLRCLDPGDGGASGADCTCTTGDYHWQCVSL